MGVVKNIERGGKKQYIPNITPKISSKITQKMYFCYSKDARQSATNKYGRNWSVKQIFICHSKKCSSSRSCQDTLGTILNKFGNFDFRKCSSKSVENLSFQMKICLWKEKRYFFGKTFRNLWTQTPTPGFLWDLWTRKVKFGF